MVIVYKVIMHAMNAALVSMVKEEYVQHAQQIQQPLQEQVLQFLNVQMRYKDII